MYRIEISPAADRDLEKLKARIRMPDFERLRNVVRSLANEPRPPGVRKIAVAKGTDKAYRIRVGNYRLVYDVYDDAKLVLILRVARRSEATYRG